MRFTPQFLPSLVMLALVAGCFNQSTEPPGSRAAVPAISPAKGAYSGLPLARPKVELPRLAPRTEPAEERLVENGPVAEFSPETLWEPLIGLEAPRPVFGAQSSRYEPSVSVEEFSSPPPQEVNAPGDFSATTGFTVGPLASTGLRRAISARVYSASRSNSRSLEIPSGAIAGPQRSLDSSAANTEVDSLQSFLEHPEASTVVAINGSGSSPCPRALDVPGSGPKAESRWLNAFRCELTGTIVTVSRNGETVPFDAFRCSFILNDVCGGQPDIVLPMATLNERTQTVFNRMTNISLCANGSEFTLYQCNGYAAVPRPGTMAQFDYYLPINTLEEWNVKNVKMVFPALNGMSPVYDLRFTLP